VVPACSKAIASKRSALHYPFEFNRWLEQHATSMPPSDPFGGAPHVPGSWHLYRNSDGTWGPHGGEMDLSRWVTNLPRTPPSRRASHLPWGSARWPGARDPNWDGVPVPKSPGKAKRRRQRLRELRERYQAELLERHQAETQTGWVGWHPATLAASEWVGWEVREVVPLSEAQLTAVGWGTGQGWGAPARLVRSRL
jgi:hypothetical protein